MGIGNARVVSGVMIDADIFVIGARQIGAMLLLLVYRFIA